MRARISAAGLLMLLSAVFGARALYAAPPPVEAFAGMPDFAMAKISPGGRFVAAKAYLDGRYALLIYDLDTPGAKPKLIGPGDMHLNWIHWKSDERLLASLWFPSRRWGAAVIETRLFAVAPDGSEPKLLVAPRERDAYPVQIADRVVDFLPDDPDHILMAFNPDDVRLPRLYRVNIHTDRRRVVEMGDSDIYWWTVDQQGRPRIGTGLDDSEMLERIFFKAPGGKDWKLFSERPVDSGARFDPVMFDPEDPDICYVLSSHEGDTMGLYRFRMSTKEFVERLFLHPDVDVGEVIRGARGDEILGVGYIVEQSQAEWFDKRQFEYVEDVRLRVGARHVRIASSSWDSSRMIMYGESPDKPGRYYLYEPATKALRYFANTYPELEKHPLSRMRAVTYKARDGLVIPAYLSLPPAITRQPGQPLPAVVFPHGGPQARDVAAFDPLVQLLTSRGYAVFQMNFRGSTGYGAGFKAAGKHQWGRAMQDDVTDGTQWLVEEGIADPHRICIVGWSYGGYAALMGAVREPGLYRCAASIAGVSDLPALLGQKRGFLFNRIATRYIGDSWKDRESLAMNSPVNRADEIQVPILLAHGTKDRVVSPSHSTAMARALRRADKTYEYVELPDADHSVLAGEERLELFHALEGFLARNLGATEAAR